jgi:hypothetical protein
MISTYNFKPCRIWDDTKQYFQIPNPSEKEDDVTAFFWIIREYGGTLFTCQILPPMTV